MISRLSWFFRKLKLALSLGNASKRNRKLRISHISDWIRTQEFDSDDIITRSSQSESALTLVYLNKVKCNIIIALVISCWIMLKKLCEKFCRTWTDWVVIEAALAKTACAAAIKVIIVILSRFSALSQSRTLLSASPLSLPIFHQLSTHIFIRAFLNDFRINWCNLLLFSSVILRDHQFTSEFFL